MEFPFDPKNMCKILTHECNNLNHGRTNCPAGMRHNCPFKVEYIVPCGDVTWKDWRDFFKEDENHAEMDK